MIATGSTGRAERFDVAIVGYGPVGAVLAGLLGRRGHKVLVLDREPGVYPLPRAAHIDHTGLRVLQELGCLERLLPPMLPNPGTDCVTADRNLLFRLPSDRPTPYSLPASMYFYQPVFDAELRRRVAELGTVSVRLGHEVRHLEDVGDVVRLQVAGPDGAGTTVEADWVVGCDGASSTVRESIGVEREGFGFAEQWLIFDLKLSTPPPSLPSLAVQVCDPARPRTELPMPDNRFRFEFMLMPGEDAAEMIRPDVAEERLLGPLLPPGSATIERTATYTFLGAVASSWRRDRVLLAGDAAHLMPPFLGQGMCSGIRDTANLAWKLDRVLAAGAPHELLDTYGLERRPHVSHVIGTAIEFGRVICKTDPTEAARRDRQLLADPRPFDERFTFRLPPLTSGPLVLEGGGRLFPQPVAGLDDWIGQRFLVFGADEAVLGEAGRWWRAQPDVLVSVLADIPDPSGRIEAWLARTGRRVAIVRPDRYVLAVTDDIDAATDQVAPLLGRGSAA
ncbi:bifunctional 3-(3-hydroxy-phenyl)propionate/3-hydroxycinnamic acid hydroxylase [Jatrophihabitans cynanchi]|uniref:Bifunctional 3-(3-hydroxy-phenyl)propionate/3-hydroxycinnamic acid hydroxylase n=1 Tax=Jatrophihabitans cynanchi TaxID=2944128 RepID=A0ABY7K566_9ACTN|nr:bifunctional 3-(3-hydroxy-phenyl)propionate/3-hydroxycinnamic acid hydroxylase [Jatrophihabitans sp. SB3-54]WAX58469.1 bifunctional 3-(3-hydroxy-phenyl)propionate/3-hydroxycinnamic acid hydroxylase [Jatrophihabitans sp. SB3-54]